MPKIYRGLSAMLREEATKICSLVDFSDRHERLRENLRRKM